MLTSRVYVIIHRRSLAHLDAHSAPLSVMCNIQTLPQLSVIITYIAPGLGRRGVRQSVRLRACGEITDKCSHVAHFVGLQAAASFRLTESVTRFRVFASATGGIDASMLSQALCRLCWCGNGHHCANLFCSLLSPLQAGLQAAHVNSSASASKVDASKTESRHPKPQGNVRCSAQKRWAVLRCALAPLVTTLEPRRAGGRAPRAAPRLARRATAPPRRSRRLRSLGLRACGSSACRRRPRSARARRGARAAAG